MKDFLWANEFNPIEFDGIKMQAGLNSEGLSQKVRIARLNRITIHQMTILTSNGRCGWKVSQ